MPKLTLVYFSMVAALLTGTLAWAENQGEPYRLQAGDEISLSVLPRVEYSFTGPISPDGLIYLKNSDPLRAEGLTLPELAERATAALERVLKRPRVSAALIRLAPARERDRIAVTGGVVRPGPVDFEADLRVRRALDLAGGPTLEADLRRVIVVHRDLSRTVIDLSAPSAASDPRRNPLVRVGDSIEVGLRERTRITVVGVVARPGPVEVLDAVTARKALELAGGALREADLTRVALTRSGAERRIVDLSDPARDLPLQDGDSLEVPLLFQPGFVSIGGEVGKAGPYPLQPGMTLEDLIVAAGKLSLVADVGNIELRRARGAKFSVNLVEQQAKGAEGRLFLEGGDEVYVPRHASVVILVGAIPNPGARALKPGQSLREFLTEGPIETLPALDETRVNLGKAQLIRRGAEPVTLNLKAILRGDRKAAKQVALQSGDILFLPARAEPRRGVLDYLRALPTVGNLIGLF